MPPMNADFGLQTEDPRCLLCVTAGHSQSTKVGRLDAEAFVEEHRKARADSDRAGAAPHPKWDPVQGTGPTKAPLSLSPSLSPSRLLPARVQAQAVVMAVISSCSSGDCALLWREV